MEIYEWKQLLMGIGRSGLIWISKVGLGRQILKTWHREGVSYFSIQIRTLKTFLFQKVLEELCQVGIQTTAIHNSKALKD